MNNLYTLFRAQEQSARWKCEIENATARYELAKINEHCAFLISQHEPIASLKLDRERLRIVFKYLKHGDLKRLERDFEELKALK